MKTISLLFLVFLMFALSSCIVPRPADISSPVTKNRSMQEPDSLLSVKKQGEVAPVSVNVENAVVKNNKLVVSAILKTRIDMNAENVSISLAGLNEGNLVREVSKKGSEIISRGRFFANSPVRVKFSIKSTGLTEYQVRCKWDMEPKSDFIASDIRSPDIKSGSPENNLEDFEVIEETVAPAIPKANLEKQLRIKAQRVNEKVLPCENNKCDKLYTVDVLVENPTGQDIDGVHLGVGLFWIKDGDVVKYPINYEPLKSNEKIVSLPEVRLAAGKTQKLRINVDRAVPIVVGGSFRPNVRLVVPEGL